MTTHEGDQSPPRNYIGGAWAEATGEQTLSVKNPATGRELATLRCSSDDDVGAAVGAARDAFPAWSSTPVMVRAQYLYTLRQVVADNADQLAELITVDNGKTLGESHGELRRALDYIESACGAPMLLQGHSLRDVSEGIDTDVIRDPLGVCAAITPFNFPVMTVAIFLSWGTVCGNTMVIKPSEQAPLATTFLFELIDRAGLPAGVANLVHGQRFAVDALLAHPEVAAISVIGSTPTARAIYEKASAAGKRVQAAGGAKNHIVVLPDANMDETSSAIVQSAFGMAGQRCLAGSVAIAVGGAYEDLIERVTSQARKLVIGPGSDAATDIGPLISAEKRDQIVGSIEEGVASGATLRLDGRKVDAGLEGYFLAPTVLADVAPEAKVAREEIFGPVLTVLQAADLNDAIGILNRSPFGNAGSIFTGSGRSAREFAYGAEVGNIGINVGVAAPVALFPFGGKKGSFFGSLHAQGRDSLDFFTDRRSIISRWFD